MNDKTFVDTNVLIYAHNVDAKAKHEVAKLVLQELWSSRSGTLSMQVLQEFYVNATREIPRPISKASARLVVNIYTIWCVETTPSEISNAFRIEDESRLGFWDALIVAAAIKSGANRILSEDLNAGQTISGVRIENPFATMQQATAPAPFQADDCDERLPFRGCISRFELSWSGTRWPSNVHGMSVNQGMNSVFAMWSVM